ADCVQVTTQAPTRPTIYTCPAAYTRVEPADPTNPPTCTKMDTIIAAVATTPASCPTAPAEQLPFQLYEDHSVGAVKRTCERTITITALTVTARKCPKGYALHQTVRDDQTGYSCRLDPPTAPSP
ncbi:MAG: hypothetical protein OXG52_02380, partial [bacterium]|nr:hypothetical protein [bacterium]